MNNRNENGVVDTSERYQARLERYYRRLSTAVKDQDLPTYTESQLEQFLVELAALVESDSAVLPAKAAA